MSFEEVWGSNVRYSCCKHCDGDWGCPEDGHYIPCDVDREGDVLTCAEGIQVR